MMMQPTHDLMTHVLANGTRQANRTGTDAISTAGEMVKFDLKEGFPATTSKKLYFKAVWGELYGFFHGYQSAAQFREAGCKVWDDNANVTPSWVNSPFRKGHDDLGRVYGAQWTDWQDTKIVPVYESHLLPSYLKLGYVVKGTLVNDDGEGDGTVIHRSINQLEEALKTLVTNPTSRRIIINGWNPSENDQIALVACHAFYEFCANVEKNELHICMMLRSSDQFLGFPFNVASTALFLEIMARLSGFKPGTVTIFVGDCHIYVNHVDQVKEQLANSHFAPPKLVLSENIKRITDLKDVSGAFKRIALSDVSLEGYVSHGTIKAPMAA